MIIGHQLRELRETKGLSQGDIEHHTGLIRCYTSRVENGHTVPSVETLEKYARALEVPLWQLFHDGNHPARPLRLSGESDEGRKESRKDMKLIVALSRLLGRMKPRDRNLLFHMAQKMATSRGKR